MKLKLTKAERSRQGFTLAELLIALSLLAPFALIAGRLFVASFKVSRDAAGAIERTARVDSAVTQLRADVWNAPSLNSHSPTELSLGRVQWHVDEHHQLWRTDGAGSKRSWAFADTRITSNGPLVVLRLVDASGQAEEAAMISQVLVAKGESR